LKLDIFPAIELDILGGYVCHRSY